MGIEIGDRVTYRDVNLRDYRGRVEAVDGQMAEVRWDRFPGFTSREWIPNLLVQA
jgi:hypothetical protein